MLRNVISGAEWQNCQPWKRSARLVAVGSTTAEKRYPRLYTVWMHCSGSSRARNEERHLGTVGGNVHIAPKILPQLLGGYDLPRMIQQKPQRRQFLGRKMNNVRSAKKCAVSFKPEFAKGKTALTASSLRRGGGGARRGIRQSQRKLLYACQRNPSEPRSPVGRSLAS